MTTPELAVLLLTIVQVICTFAFGGKTFLQILKTTKGLNVTWFLFWEFFLILNLVLAWHADNAQSSFTTRATWWGYFFWTAMITLNLVAIIWKWPGWKRSDMINIALSGAGILVILLAVIVLNRDFSDPMIKGWLAVFCKTIPQVLLAYEIWRQKGGGPPKTSIITGHVTILMRLGQLAFSIAEAGWDSNRIASALSEIANELSWIIVTIFWAKKYK